MTTLDIARLSPEERLRLIGDLWNSLEDRDVPLTPAQEAELGRRMLSFDADAAMAVPWEEVDADLGRRSR